MQKHFVGIVRQYPIVLLHQGLGLIYPIYSV